MIGSGNKDEIISPGSTYRLTTQYGLQKVELESVLKDKPGVTIFRIGNCLTEGGFAGDLTRMITGVQDSFPLYTNSQFSPTSLYDVARIAAGIVTGVLKPEKSIVQITCSDVPISRYSFGEKLLATIRLHPDIANFDHL